MLIQAEDAARTINELCAPSLAILELLVRLCSEFTDCLGFVWSESQSQSELKLV